MFQSQLYNPLLVKKKITVFCHLTEEVTMFFEGDMSLFMNVNSLEK